MPTKVPAMASVNVVIVDRGPGHAGAGTMLSVHAHIWGDTNDGNRRDPGAKSQTVARLPIGCQLPLLFQDGQC
jgi:hypothetical protein